MSRKKNTLAFFRKLGYREVTEGQSVQVSVAEEKTILDVPPTVADEVDDVDAPPPADVPTHVDDGDTTFFVLDKEEVGITISADTSVLT